MKSKLLEDNLSNNNVDDVTQTLHDLIEIAKKNLTYEEQINEIITGETFSHNNLSVFERFYKFWWSGKMNKNCIHKLPV